MVVVYGGRLESSKLVALYVSKYDEDPKISRTSNRKLQTKTCLKECENYLDPVNTGEDRIMGEVP